MDQDIVLLHQVHPIKLAADISASTLSNVLLWRHRVGLGLAVRIGLPVLGSSVVLARGDIERLRDSRAGRYVVTNMPRQAVAIRMAGDVVMAVGAWRHSWRTMAIGASAIVVGWSHGLWSAPSTLERMHRPPTS
jgi:hypothetical protein